MGDLLIGLGPFVVLLIFVGVVIFRGMRTKPDDTANKARGGGSASHHVGPD